MNPTMQLPVEQVAKVVKRHLVTQRDSGASEDAEDDHADHSEITVHDSNQQEDSDSHSIDSTIRNAYKLPGGSIVDGIYKWTAHVESQRKQRLLRSQSISFPIPEQSSTHDLSQRLKQPGGFRRHYVLSKAAKQGRKPPNLWTNSFAEFLCLYGHFGGEDLSDDEELESNSDEDEEAVIGYGSSILNEASSSKTPSVNRTASASYKRKSNHDRPAIASTSGRRRTAESTPLLSKPKPNPPAQGTATPAKAVFLLLKSFVTTGKNQTWLMLNDLLYVLLTERFKQESCSYPKRMNHLKFDSQCN
jgi:proton-coupled amino acid transporter